MAKLDDQKKMCKKMISNWSLENKEIIVTSDDVILAAFGSLNQAKFDAIKIQLDSLNTEFIADHQSIDSSKNPNQLKSAMKSIIERKTNPDEWRDMLGPGERIN